MNARGLVNTNPRAFTLTGAFPSTPSRDYRFDEDTGTTINDSSSSGQHVSISGTGAGDGWGTGQGYVLSGDQTVDFSLGMFPASGDFTWLIHQGPMNDTTANAGVGANYINGSNGSNDFDVRYYAPNQIRYSHEDDGDTYLFGSTAVLEDCNTTDSVWVITKDGNVLSSWVGHDDGDYVQTDRKTFASEIVFGPNIILEACTVSGGADALVKTKRMASWDRTLTDVEIVKTLKQLLNP